LPLNIVVCDSSKRFLINFSDTLQKIAMKKRYDAKISFVCLSPERILSETFPSADCKYLFIIEMFREYANVYKQIRKLYEDAYICFTTAEKSMSAMKFFINLNLKPSGIIVKPPDFYEMAEVIGQIYSDFENSSNIMTQAECLSVNVGFDIHKIPIADIVYFEAVAKKVEIHTIGKSVGYYANLYELEDKLGGGFIRCHRSYLVNLKRIKSVIFTDMLIVLENGANIPISRTYKQKLKEIWGGDA